jgi:hypothetical protein
VRLSLGNRCIRLGALTAVLVAYSTGIGGAGQTAPEASLKAAFLYNFARFTEWPGDALTPNAPLVICSTDAAVSAALGQMTLGRQIAGRRLEVRPVTPDPAPLRACHLLYLHALSAAQTTRLLNSLRDMPVLTASDLDGFTQLGGAVQFLNVDGQLRFAISMESTRRARLRLSPQLLGLAKIV